MKRVQKVVFILLGIGLVTACAVIFFVQRIEESRSLEPVPEKPAGVLDISGVDQAIVAKLRTAPGRGCDLYPLSENGVFMQWHAKGARSI